MVNRIINKNANQSARDRLLDAAEQLFAQKGFTATGIREITNEANSNIAAVNYHFGSKENLYCEVFRRRLIVLREMRITSIDKVISQTKHEPTLEELIRAFAASFIGPQAGDDQLRRFRDLMIREMSDPHLPKRVFLTMFSRKS